MKRRAIFFIVFAALVGCGPVAPRPAQSASTLEAITYVKDARTGLCFGMVMFPSYAGFTGTSITNVPCDSVARFLR